MGLLVHAEGEVTEGIRDRSFIPDNILHKL
jgi:hypothetical protein